MGQHRGLRLECKWKKSSEATGFILQLPQLPQMVDALSQRFDMSVKHRARAPAAHAVPSPMNIEPFSSGFLSAPDRIAHSRVENFRAATGNRAEARLA